MADISGIVWHPISELTSQERYGTEAGFLLCAPELVDLDCNTHGVGPGYWQDYEGWLAAKWSMSNDEWYEVKCNPTHFARINGPL